MEQQDQPQCCTHDCDRCRSNNWRALYRRILSRKSNRHDLGFVLNRYSFKVPGQKLCAPSTLRYSGCWVGNFGNRGNPDLPERGAAFLTGRSDSDSVPESIQDFIFK